MAKKRGSGNLNMAAAIREVLSEQPTLSGREARDEVQRRHPEAVINEKSFGVAFSNARKALGIAAPGRKKSVRRRKPGRAAATTTSSAAAPKTLDFDLLDAARGLLAKAGDADTAIAAIKQLARLQIR